MLRNDELAESWYVGDPLDFAEDTTLEQVTLEELLEERELSLNYRNDENFTDFCLPYWKQLRF
jgi:hypothetical protein